MTRPGTAELPARFGRRSSHASSPCHPISILAAESMRNAVMAQAIFVPGIDTIYRELLSEEGEEVCKLLVSAPVDPAFVDGKVRRRRGVGSPDTPPSSSSRAARWLTPMPYRRPMCGWWGS